jgi:ribonucleoside-diphosphate reductase alpha chain
MQTYSFDETLAESVKYFDGDELASSVTVGKYLLRNKEDKIIENNPAQIVNRVASELFRAESAYPNPMPRDSIFEVLDHFRFTIPQGSPLAGIGNNHQVVSIGNCFMIGSPYDSWGGICWKDQELAQIMKRRGGVGVDLSSLRPKFSPVENAARLSDGIECFANKYSNTTKSVAQNGRRGALLISIDCRHPDIETFITMKCNKTKVTGANISVKWSDDFLSKLEEPDNKICIELNNGEKIFCNSDEQIEIDGKIMKAMQFRDICNNHCV